MIIVLEGHSYSGKTTIIKAVEKLSNVSVIAEYDEYANGIKNYPPFPARNEQMAINNVDFFVDLETQRLADIVLNLNKTHVCDRSFISVILFQKFLKHLALPGYENAYEYSKQKFQAQIEQEEVIVPDYLIFVSCVSDEIYRKREGREISVDILKGAKASNFFNSEYKSIAQIYDKLGRSLEMYSDNTSENLAFNTELIGMFAKSGKGLSRSDFRTVLEGLWEII